MKATRPYIEGICSFISGNSGIKIQEGKGFSANVQSKTLTLNIPELQKMDYRIAKGLILHEAGHIKYTKVKKDPNITEDIQQVYNAIEDLRIENQLRKDYGEYAAEPIKSTITSGLKNIARQDPEEWKHTPDIEKILIGSMALYDVRKGAVDPDTKWEIAAKIGSDLYDVIDDISSEIAQAAEMDSTEEMKKYINEKIIPMIKQYLRPDNPDRKNAGASIMEAAKGSGSDRAEPETMPDPEDVELLLKHQIDTLAHKLNQILKEKAISRYTGSHRSGKLISKNAYKVVTGENRIFSRRTNPDRPEYSVTMLLDGSGSMQGRSHTQTYITAAMLEKVFQKLNFKILIVNYSDHARIIKTVGEYRAIEGGGTNDLQAAKLAWRYQDLKKDNLWLVFTDGCAGEEPAEVIRMLQKHNIPIITIGVGLIPQIAAQLGKYWKNPVAVPKAEDLPKTLIGVMQRLIHR